MTEDAQDAPAPKGGFVSELVEIVKTITVALLIALVLRIFLFQPYTIPSGSEEPNLYKGDYIIVSKYSYGYSKHSIPFSPPLFNGRIFFHAPRRGDIIVFKLPRQPHVDYIKRLMGLPGDHIQVRDGIVYINGQPLPRQFVKTVKSDVQDNGDLTDVKEFKETNPEGRSYLSNSFFAPVQADNTGVYVVPPHCYFMMGDNRDNSLDSRFDPGMEGQPVGPGYCGWNPAVQVATNGYDEYGVGFVPEQNLVGRAQLVFLSWDSNVSLFKPWTWFLDARPSRFFHILK